MINGIDSFKGICYAPVMREGGFSLGIVVEGQRGYYETDYPLVSTYEEATEWARSLNNDLGLSEKETIKLILMSMRKD